jgi:hypothetical protein
MPTIDEIMQVYDDGIITADELFGLLLPMLALLQPEAVRRRLATASGLEEAFEEWIGDVSSGAEVVSGGRPVRISDDDRAAIARYLKRTQAARYARLADHIKQWMAELHEEEPVLGPDDIPPFLSTDIEPLLGEVIPT